MGLLRHLDRHMSGDVDTFLRSVENDNVVMRHIAQNWIIYLEKRGCYPLTVWEVARGQAPSTPILFCFFKSTKSGI